MKLKLFCFFILYLIIRINNIYSNENNFIKIYKGLNLLKEEKINLNKLKKTDYSFHFLLPTIGRKSIFRILKSLEKQIESQDFLTIIFDAKDEDSILEKVRLITAKFKCKINIIFEQNNLGFWGHGIRNKYQDLPGDFILHCDDDDVYTSNSILNIRKICQDKNKLYIFRMKRYKDFSWQETKIDHKNMGTPIGVIPANFNKLGKWGYFRQGDGEFYIEVSQKIGPQNIIFVDYIIYKVRNS